MIPLRAIYCKRKLLVLAAVFFSLNCLSQSRERISINDGWKFMRYTTEPDKLIYDERPLVANRNDNVIADTKATDTSSAGSGKGL
ncbi:MAG: hypothetical protein JNN00_13760, partial [Chitinophagaceae bacterium]|nr:hypothetical protein [Chitinophagaceae bacterium]